MAQFEITAPDGNKYQVTAPDGASHDDVLSYVKQQIIPSAEQTRGRRAEQLAQDKLLYSPTVGMGAGERFAAGYGGGLPALFQGAGQRLGLVGQQAIDENAALDRPLLDTTAGGAGRAAGLTMPFLATSGIPGANTVAGSAIAGGLFGALQPTPTGGPSVAGNVARDALLGGGTAIATRLLPTAAKSLIDPFLSSGRETIAGRTLLSAAGSNAPNVMANAANPRTFVPGSLPNLAEATQDTGIAGLQLAASSASPEVKRQLAQRASSNTGARLDVLNNIAGTPLERGWYEGVRDMMSGPLYQQAKTEGIDQAAAKANQSLIQNLLDRMPSGVLDRARELARINGETMGPEGSVQGLQWMKMAVDDMISGAGSSAVGGQMKRALTQFKGDLMATAEQLSPKFAEANRAYADWSKPLNQMEIGQYLKDKMVPSLMDFAEGVPTRIKANSYTDALRNAPATMSNATGLSGYQSLDKIMSAPQMTQLTNIAQDLARSATAQDLAKSAGSPTAQNLAGQNLLRQLIGPAGMPQSWTERLISSSLAAPMTRFTNLAYSGAEQKIQETLARALADPAYAAQIMRGAAGPTVENAVVQSILRSGMQGATMLPAGIAGSR